MAESPHPTEELNELLETMRGRFAQIEWELTGLQKDIRDYTLRAARAEPEPVPPQFETAPEPEPEPERLSYPPATSPVPPPAAAPQQDFWSAEPQWVQRSAATGSALLARARGNLSLSDFLGLRGLAWAGGVITLLGIAFFFVLASQGGWVGPGARVLLGAGLSAGLLALAWRLRTTHGQAEAALASVGTGVAGLYVSLFAATKMYDYLPAAAGLPLAVAVAGVAVAIALLWSSEALALLGLAGAGLSPVLVQHGVTPLGMGFVEIVTGAALVLWALRGWRIAPATATAIALPQLLVLIGHHLDRNPPFGFTPFWQTVILVVGMWAIYVSAGFHRYLGRGLDSVAQQLFVSTSTGMVGVVAVMFSEGARGYAMLAVAAGYAGVTGLPWLLGRPNRNLATILGGTALTAVLIGTAALLGGGSRAMVLSAEAALLVIVSRRLGEQRFQHAAVAYLGIAAVFTAVQAPFENLVEFPPRNLLNANSRELDTHLLLTSVASAVAFACSVAVLALAGSPMSTDVRAWRRLAGSLALASGIYAASLATLDGFVWLHMTHRSFENGHTVVSLIVAGVGVSLLVAGLSRHSTDLRSSGFVLLGAAVAKLFLYDLVTLNLMARAVAFIAVGLLLLAGGILYQRLWDDPDRDGSPAPA